MNLSYNSSIGVPEASLSKADDPQNISHSVHANFDSESADYTQNYDNDNDAKDAEIVYTQQPMLTSVSPFMIIILAVVLILFFILFSSLANPVSPASNDMGFDAESMSSPAAPSGSSGASVKILSAIMWGTFIVVVLLNGMQYFYNINFTAKLSNLFSMSPALDVTVDPIDDTSVSVPPVPEITISKQVFHIPGNKYNYENAEALCKAYGARLASYSEVENAYTNGGEWCSYGWSKDQMALFPTQKSTWTELQSVKGHENDCGRPGINGGYIANENVRFGANCYGYKPKINQVEKDMMDSSSIYPKTMEDIKQDKRVEHWKRKIPDILVAPFNNKVWSLL
jgi:hypothetical protein